MAHTNFNREQERNRKIAEHQEREFRARVAALDRFQGFVRLDGSIGRSVDGEAVYSLYYKSTAGDESNARLICTRDWNAYQQAFLYAVGELRKQSRWSRPDLSNWWDRAAARLPVPKKPAVIETRRRGRRAA